MQTRWMNRRNETTGEDERFYPITHKDAVVGLDAAGSSLGLVKSGGDVTVADGIITVNDDSHNHIISNVDGLQSALDGKLSTTGTAAKATTLTGLTATVAELNILDGITATTTELNYVDGVTSNIQTQINTLNTGLESALSQIDGFIDWFDKGVSIPNNSDLDTYITPGKYYCGSTDSSATLVNSPVTNDNFVLYVLRRTTGSSITQIIITLNGKLFIRGASSNGSLRTWNEKANVGHAHAISDIDELQTALDGKAASSHNHGAGEITSGTLGVARGGTGSTTFTSGAALIGAGTGAVTTRSITNNTALTSAISRNTNLVTMNTLSYALARTTNPTQADTNYTTYMVRAIAANTSALTAGSSTLTNGSIYLQYE